MGLGRIPQSLCELGHSRTLPQTPKSSTQHRQVSTDLLLHACSSNDWLVTDLWLSSPPQLINTASSPALSRRRRDTLLFFFQSGSEQVAVHCSSSFGAWLGGQRTHKNQIKFRQHSKQGRRQTETCVLLCHTVQAGGNAHRTALCPMAQADHRHTEPYLSPHSVMREEEDRDPQTTMPHTELPCHTAQQGCKTPTCCHFTQHRLRMSPRGPPAA